MKQETIEEAAEKYGNCFGYDEDSVQQHLAAKYGFIAGAKWQQEKMYSEEEVIKLLSKISFDRIHKKCNKTIPKWFEKFKKK